MVLNQHQTNEISRSINERSFTTTCLAFAKEKITLKRIFAQSYKPVKITA